MHCAFEVSVNDASSQLPSSSLVATECLIKVQHDASPQHTYTMTSAVKIRQPPVSIIIVKQSKKNTTYVL